ncbi:MAG: co-chaperone GroES [Candidatus Colwellbacteria bacterium]
MELKPLGSRVFIEVVEEEKTTESGIVIPETAEKERLIKGRVLAVGPGRLNDKGDRVPVSVTEGDVVLFKKKYDPDEVKVDGKKYLVADEEDILAVIK